VIYARIWNPAAHAAIQAQGTVFEAHDQRLRGREAKPHNRVTWAAHRIGRLIWKILQDGVTYQERGQRLNTRARQEAC